MSVGAITWAWKQRCSPAAKTVLLALADHADDDGVCWPGRKGLAWKVGITPRNITRHLATLVRLGLIEAIEQNRPDGSRMSNLYRLVGVSILTGGMDGSDQGVWTNSPRGMDEIDQTGTTIEPPEEPPVTLTDREKWPDWFATLWGIPGFKVSLENAREWLQKRGIGEDHAETTAYSLKSKWPGPKRSPYKDPWATFQAWVKRPPLEGRNNGRGQGFDNSPKKFADLEAELQRGRAGTG